MFQAGVAIVERDAPIEGLIDLYFGASEAEPACLLGNLEASALPLHDVVVTNHALVHQAADTIEDLRSSTPLAESRSMALARRSSLVRRSCSTPHKRSTRPLACGLLAAMKVTLSCSKARPNWVGWRFPASCSSTVQWSSLRTKMPL